MVFLRRVRFHPRDFINKWTRQRFLLPSGILKIFLLPTLCDDVRLFFFQSENEAIAARGPFVELLFKFRVRFQRAQFTAEALERSALDGKEQADWFASRELD